MTVREAENRLDTDESVSRRDNISLQGTATIITAARDTEEEEDVTIRAVLSQLINTIISVFNLAFLTVMKTAAVSRLTV
ncbi:hypothetical protein BDFG_09559 [Blastomyces dermatitidis ATCC 26199]|nr:hypothetical protein BDFG_09559 [Blastomyces dermatitidis ATCC 26199]